MAVALVVAAGRGERLGYGMPKALVPLGGRPMLSWCVEALREVAAVHAIVVALPAAETAGVSALLGDGVVCVAGGEVRSASVLAALRAAPAEPDAPGDAAVIVHDAARPLASAELFGRALLELRASGADAVVAAAPVSDTVKEVAEDGSLGVLRTLRRDRLWAVQTPQVFRRAALTAALEDATPAELAAATDDAGLIEARGGRVQLLESSALNLKVTTPLDLRMAELLLAERGEVLAR